MRLRKVDGIWGPPRVFEDFVQLPTKDLALFWEGYAYPGYQIPLFGGDLCNEPALDSGFVGIRDWNGDGVIDGLELWWDPDQTTFRGVIQETIPVIIPHFGNGSQAGISIDSTISLENVSLTREVMGEVHLKGDDGQALATGFEGAGTTSRLEFTIPPGGKVEFVSDGQGEIVQGSAWIWADGPIGAVARFNISGFGIAGVGSRPAEREVIIPVRKVGTLSTGVAYTNTSGMAKTFNFTLRDSSGTVAGTTTRQVAKDGHGASFIDGLFPALVTGDYDGTLVISVEGLGSFSTEAIEQGPGKLTTLPVKPVQP